jgi:hypothetical protein
MEKVAEHSEFNMGASREDSDGTGFFSATPVSVWKHDKGPPCARLPSGQHTAFSRRAKPRGKSSRIVEITWFIVPGALLQLSYVCRSGREKKNNDRRIEKSATVAISPLPIGPLALLADGEQVLLAGSGRDMLDWSNKLA